MSNFLMVSGLGLFCLALGMIYTRLQFYRDSKTMSGRVIDYRRGERRRIMYAPVIEFDLPESKKITFTSKLFSNKKRYEIGAQVPVRYKMLNPQNAEINKSWIIWFDVPLCLIFSFVMLWLGSR